MSSDNRRTHAEETSKPDEIVAKLRVVDVLVSQGRPVADAIRAVRVTELTYYRGRCCDPRLASS